MIQQSSAGKSVMSPKSDWTRYDILREIYSLKERFKENWKPHTVITLMHELRLEFGYVVTFVGDKLERVAEDSKSWLSLLWTIIDKLVAQSVATLSTQNLRIYNTKRCPPFFPSHQHFGDFGPPWQHFIRWDSPWRQWESPSSLWRCPLWWCLWTPARETSEQTLTDWRTEGGYTWSTHTSLQGKVDICHHPCLLACKSNSS